MPYYEKVITSGRVVEVERYYTTLGGRAPRSPKAVSTAEEAQRINERNARKKLARLINANYTEEDIFITLTYKKEPGRETAQKELQKFLRKLRNKRRKLGLPELKYIASTEDETRMHHHIVINDMDWGQIPELWSHGRVLISNLIPDDDLEYAILASYMIKETKGLPREEWAQSKRWTCSRNLEKPEIEVKEIKRFNPLLPPREVAGIEKGLKKYKGFRLVSWVSGGGQYKDYQYVRMIRMQTGSG